MAGKASEPCAAAPGSAKKASKERPKPAATESPPSAPSVNGGGDRFGCAVACPSALDPFSRRALRTLPVRRRRMHSGRRVAGVVREEGSPDLL
ncbi:unnamed protein product [Vitrella brassicaformis CCMP3155]|uniref:Uncharacterized protein n=1 Tax=Vitrella brassicaformis (strain CCMP3155) TaxID=1169540 RepID=A0A0G4FK94_VITBC|nr:unnamed protein product [Vitrella brassicaformis CCMP3155]|eukprot:CEM14200.1 unnamed protein product [Vitrella brassicaformis CCMP3155]